MEPKSAPPEGGHLCDVSGLSFKLYKTGHSTDSILELCGFECVINILNRL